MSLRFGLLHERLLQHIRDRIRAGYLTERHLSRLSGISQPHVNNVLKGVRRLSPAAADHLLEHLKIDLLDLVERAEWRNPEVEIPEITYKIISIPLLNEPIGPEYQAPKYEDTGLFHPVWEGRIPGLVQPVAGRVAADPHLNPCLQCGDIVILDRAVSPRLHPSGEAFWVVASGGTAMIRRLTLSGEYLVSSGHPFPGNSANPSISLRDRNILDIVQARVAYLERRLENPTETRQTPAETCGEY